jgi:hypothetical protein
MHGETDARTIAGDDIPRVAATMLQARRDAPVLAYEPEGAEAAACLASLPPPAVVTAAARLLK